MAIYSYGSGQPYATPQAAFDACQAANESGGVPQNFTETNAIRGYGDAAFGAAGTGLPVLRLCHSTTGRGVLPTQANRLVLDRNGRDRVEFSDTENMACIVGGSDDGTVATSHVTIDLPGLHSSQAATGKAVIVNPGYMTGYVAAFDWDLKNGDIHAAQFSLVIGGLLGLRLSNVRFLGLNSGACLFADDGGIYGSYQGPLTMLNCVGRAEGKIIDLVSNSPALSLLHCSLYSPTETLIRLLNGGGIASPLILNSILHTDGAGKYLISTDFPDTLFQVAASNGNCFWYPGAGSHLLDFAGTPIDLADWKDLWGQDAHSLNLDPQLTDPAAGDFGLQVSSPCRMRGRAAVNAGLEGNERALSIDIGAYQPSLAANWSLSAVDGEITANIQGRVPVRGL